MKFIFLAFWVLSGFPKEGISCILIGWKDLVLLSETVSEKNNKDQCNSVWFLSQLLNWELTTYWLLTWSWMDLVRPCHYLSHTLIDLSSHWMWYILVRHLLPKDTQVLQIIVKTLRVSELGKKKVLCTIGLCWIGFKKRWDGWHLSNLIFILQLEKPKLREAEVFLPRLRKLKSFVFVFFANTLSAIICSRVHNPVSLFV